MKVTKTPRDIFKWQKKINRKGHKRIIEPTKKKEEIR